MTDVRLYRLKGSMPTSETDPAAWAQWMKSAGPRTRVAVTQVEGVIVHTAFTGIDMRPDSAVAAQPRPRVWATTVTAPNGAKLTGYDGLSTTYQSRRDAAKGHAQMVKLLRRIMHKMRANGDGPASSAR